MKQQLRCLYILLLCTALLAGCSSLPSAAPSSAHADTTPIPDVIVEDEQVAANDAPPAESSPVSTGEAPPAPLEKRNGRAVIDYSHTAEGYVMAQYTAMTDKRLKAQVAGPTITYTYDLTQGQWAVFPLSDGNGSYKVTVFENTTGNKYSPALSLSFEVTLNDEFAPFLHPNQYVDYSAAPNTVAKAEELAGTLEAPSEKIAAIYHFVVTELTYDTEKADTVESGYLPVLDTVLAERTGICFDYAALMAGMLRSQGIPCQLVVGYAGSAYHAWVNVWSEETGWQRMDPTFASSAGQDDSILAYIGDGENYTEKYLY